MLTVLPVWLANRILYSLCYSQIMHFQGMQHQHRRMKKTKQQKSAYTVFLDKLTFVVGIVGPFTVLPQIYSIFSTQSAAGVSLVTWFLIFLMTIPWILYGIAHKNKLILTCFALWGFFDLLVVIGVILYGGAPVTL